MRALLKLKEITWPAVAVLGFMAVGCGSSGENLPPDFPAELAEACKAANDAAKEADLEPVCQSEKDCPAEAAFSSCVNYTELLEAATLNPHSNHPVELALAFKQIKFNKPDDAKATLTPFLTAEDEPEVYTYLAASLKSGIDALAPLLDLISSQLAPSLAGGLMPAQTDFRTFVQSVLQPVIDNLEDIADQAPLIQASPDTYLNIPSIPLSLDPSVLDDSLPADLEMDLGGGFDRPELLAFGAAANGILGGIDFLFAHSLKLRLGDVSDLDSSSGIAGFLAKSTDLLVLDKPENIATAKTRFVAALDYLVGTADGSLGKNGLLAAIEDEMADAGGQDGDIIVFRDVDGDGQVSEADELELKFIAQLIDDIEELEAGDEILSVPVSRDVWVALIDLGRVLNANLGGGASFSLAKYLSAKVAGAPAGTKYLWEELQEAVTEEIADPDSDFDFPGALPDLVDWIHLDPKAYFANPVGLRNLLPAITVIEIGTAKEYEFALECELSYTIEQFRNPAATGGLSADSLIRAICAHKETGKAMRMKRIIFSDSVAADATTETDFVAEGGDAVTDFTHFSSFAVGATDGEGAVTRTADLEASSVTDMTNPVLIPLTFADGLAPAVGDRIIKADGYKPANHVDGTDGIDILLSGLLQTPDLGGTLLLDLDPSTASPGHVKATNSTLNAAISQIWISFYDHIEALVDGLTDDEE